MSSTLFRYWMREDWPDARDGDPLVLAAEPVGEHVVRMTKQVAGLRTQVQELSAAVSVLMKALAERGGLDLADLEARIDREYAARCAPRAQPPVTCVRCKRTVAANTTEITANGVVCEKKCT